MELGESEGESTLKVEMNLEVENSTKGVDFLNSLG
jgi:hypothetical protein